MVVMDASMEDPDIISNEDSDDIDGTGENDDDEIFEIAILDGIEFTLPGFEVMKELWSVLTSGESTDVSDTAVELRT